tara:strand:+ start:37054 stop:38268 length:1215 start_codon:yes stop_codon:yes gene_type:complete
MQNCCVVGLGYIGLPTAALIAKSNNFVLGVDINKNVVDTINKGKVHFFEPGLENLVKETITEKKFKASLNPSFSDVFVIAVPTPFKKKEGKIPQPDIQFVLSAARSISPYLRDGNLIIIESTSPVGTTEKVKEEIEKFALCNTDNIHICYCPERVIPGNIINELVLNNRVIGGIKNNDAKMAKIFYESFCKGNIQLTDVRTAELVKLAENTFRDVNIALANELSMICDNLNIDVHELIHLSNQHPRVNILNPGCGVGGHCIAIDPWFIASACPEASELIQIARKVNNDKAEWVTNKIIENANILKNTIGRDPKIGCLGLTFKPDVDDIRESPAIKIVENLISVKAELLICEPKLLEFDIFELKSLNYVLENSDMIVILVSHKEFKGIDFLNKLVFDFCGINSLF